MNPTRRSFLAGLVALVATPRLQSFIDPLLEISHVEPLGRVVELTGSRTFVVPLPYGARILRKHMKIYFSGDQSCDISYGGRQVRISAVDQRERVIHFAAPADSP